MAVNKIKLPNNTVQDIHDARIPGVDSTPTSGSTNVVTSDGIKAYVDGLTGNLTNLETTVKSTLVGAINELAQGGGGGSTVIIRRW